MRYKNPVLQNIYQNVVEPEMKNIPYSVEGQIISVDYHKQTADIWYSDPTSMGAKQHYRIPLPRENDGVFRQSVKIGDRVNIGFRNGNKQLPYISVVYREEMSSEDFTAKFGSGIPKGIGYL